MLIPLQNGERRDSAFHGWWGFGFFGQSSNVRTSESGWGEPQVNCVVKGGARFVMLIQR